MIRTASCDADCGINGTDLTDLPSRPSLPFMHIEKALAAYDNGDSRQLPSSSANNQNAVYLNCCFCDYCCYLY